MTDIVQQLRDAAGEESRPVDWTAFNEQVAQASSAAEAGRHADAAREYLRAITHLMDQLRQLRDADSGGREEVAG